MSEPGNPFQALSSDLKAKMDAEQRLQVDCATIMDSIILPSVRAARQAIQHPRIIWGEGQQPSIKVKGEYQYELAYKCNGAILDVTQFVGGYNASLEIALEKVSKEYIVNQIESFLRDALDLKT
jgi:hypothetical protein